MQIRKATQDDMDSLADNRLEFVCLIGDIQDPAEFRSKTKEYLQKHMEDHSLLSFIAVDEGKIVSSGILCIYETLPIPSCLSGKCGLLLNVYTHKDYRRQGLAANVLTELIAEARQLGVGKIQLSYTDDGFPLYKKLGFETLDREMVLKID